MAWTRIIGRVLINVGVVILGIVAAKELVDSATDVATALQNGTEPDATYNPLSVSPVS